MIGGTEPEGFAGKYSTPNYGEVAYKIKVVDGIAIWTFSDRRLARDMYNFKKEQGLKVYFKERLSSFGEIFSGKTREEIINLIAKEHAELIIYNKNKK